MAGWLRHLLLALAAALILCEAQDRSSGAADTTAATTVATTVAPASYEQRDAPSPPSLTECMKVFQVKEFGFGNSTSTPLGGSYSAGLVERLKNRSAFVQIVISLGFLAAGALCLYNGPAMWKGLFTCTASFLAFEVAIQEADSWGISGAASVIIAVELAAAIAFATWSGFEGSQVLLGVVVGATASHGFGGWHLAGLQEAPVLSLMGLTVGLGFGVASCVWFRDRALSTLGPLLGGYLTTASVGVLLSRLVHVFASQEVAATALANATASGAALDGGPLPGPTRPWLSAAGSLFGPIVPSTALAIHGLCAMVAAACDVGGPEGFRLLVMTGKVQNHRAAVLILLTGIALTLILELLSLLCPSASEDNRGACPLWMEKKPDWLWCVLGCIVWAITTGVRAYFQLVALAEGVGPIGAIHEGEAKQLIPTPGEREPERGGYSPVTQSQAGRYREQYPAFATQPQFPTQLPTGSLGTRVPVPPPPALGLEPGPGHWGRH